MMGYKGAHKRIKNGKAGSFGSIGLAVALALGIVLGLLGIAGPASATTDTCDKVGYTKINEESGTADLPFGSLAWGGAGGSTETTINYVVKEGYTLYLCAKASDEVHESDPIVGPVSGTFDTGDKYAISHIGWIADYEEPPVTPEGSNNSSSPACEQITVGTPTGVKPEDATVVVKLNGEVTQPGTYEVEPGEYTVTTYVNGELVDTDMVTVTKCEDEVAPEGNLAVSSTCESITFSSTGVKPEDAEQIFKLDGAVKAPGAYPVAAGSHTVELFVNGELVDSETVTVEECEEPPVTPEGSNNSSSSVCKQIIVGQPTGVKPEGATVVVKLDGVVTQPGTYATTPGTHVVTTYVNGVEVDKDTVVVADCPVVPPPTPYDCPPGTVWVGDLNGNGVKDPAECQEPTTPTPTPTPEPEPKKVKGHVKVLDKCESNNFFFAKKVKGLHYVVKGKIVREGKWLKSATKRLVVKVVADSNKFVVKGKKKFVFVYANTASCSPIIDEPPHTGL